MRLARACIVAALVTGVMGCDLLSKKDEEPPVTPPTPPAIPSAAPVASAAANVVKDEAANGADSESDPILKEIPTPEDFEEEAVEDINAQNLDDELDKIEKEIEG